MPDQADALPGSDLQIDAVKRKDRTEMFLDSRQTGEIFRRFIDGTGLVCVRLDRGDRKRDCLATGGGVDPPDQRRAQCRQQKDGKPRFHPRTTPASNRVERVDGIALEVLLHLGPHFAMDVGLYPLLLKRLVFEGDAQDIVAISVGTQKLHVAKAGLRGYRSLERPRIHLLRGRGLPGLHFDSHMQHKHDLPVSMIEDVVRDGRQGRHESLLVGTDLHVHGIKGCGCRDE